MLNVTEEEIHALVDNPRRPPQPAPPVLRQRLLQLPRPLPDKLGREPRGGNGREREGYGALRLAELLNFLLVVDTSSGEEMNLSEPGSRVIFVWPLKF